MKKLIVDKQYFKICLYAFLLAAAVITFEKISGNLDATVGSVRGFLRFASRILTPFLYGFAIAYVSNPLVRSFDRLLDLIPGLKSKKSKRMISISVTFVAIFLIIGLIIRYLAPEIITTFKNASDNLRSYISLIQNPADVTAANESVLKFFNQTTAQMDEFFNTVNSTFNTSFNSQTIANILIDGLDLSVASLPGLAMRIFSGAISFAGSLFNLVLGFFAAFYMLSEKEDYSESAKKLVYAVSKKGRAERFIEAVKKSNVVFERFIIGKTLDSLVVGTIFFIAALILRLPYALLLSVIIFLANMVPFIGPFFGAVPVISIVLISSLSSVSDSTPFSIYPTLFTTIVILILQQLDGNVIAPKILGESTGLKPLEVIFAIIVGGALFGILGMFLGVPVFAVIKIMLGSLIDRKYREKTLSAKDDTPSE